MLRSNHIFCGYTSFKRPVWLQTKWHTSKGIIFWYQLSCPFFKVWPILLQILATNSLKKLLIGCYRISEVVSGANMWTTKQTTACERTWDTKRKNGILLSEAFCLMPFWPSERYAYLTYGCALKIMASHWSKEELGIRCRRSGAQPGGNFGKIEVKRKFLVHLGEGGGPEN